MLNKYIRMFIVSFFIFLTFNYTRVSQALSSLKYYKKALETYDINVSVLEDYSEGITLLSTNNKDIIYLTKSSLFSLFAPYIINNNRELKTALIVCDDTFSIDNKILCDSEKVFGDIEKKVYINKNDSILITSSGNVRLLLIPEYYLIDNTTRSETVTQLQSLFGIINSSKPTLNIGLLESYFIPWLEIIGSLSIVSFIFFLYAQFVRKERINFSKLISIINNFLEDKLFPFIRKRSKYIFIFAIVFGLASLSCLTVFILVKYSVVTQKTLNSGIQYLSDTKSIIKLINYKEYYKLMFLFVFYSTGILSMTLFFLLSLVFIIRPSFPVSTKKMSLKNICSFYLILNFFIIFSFYFIINTRLIIIFLALDLFLLTVLGPEIFKSVSILSRKIRVNLILFSTLFTFLYLLIFVRTIFYGSDKGISYIELAGSINHTLLLPLEVNNPGPENKRFSSYKVKPEARIFLGGTLIFDPDYTNIYNKPITSINENNNYIIVGKMGKKYIENLIKVVSGYNTYFSKNKTQICKFEVPYNIADDEIDMHITFSCDKSPADFEVVLKRYEVVSNSLKTERISPIHFPGCLPEQGEVTYSIQLSDLGGFYEFDDTSYLYLEKFEIGYNGVSYKPVYLKTPSEYTIMGRNEKESEDLYVYSLSDEFEYDTTNIDYPFDLSKAINRVLENRHNIDKIILWSDIPDLVLNKL